MTNINTIKKEPIFIKSTETNTIQSFKPCMWQHWLKFIILAFSIYLSFKAFGLNTITGICILSISSFLIVSIILSNFTTKYLITHRGILVKKRLFSKKFKEIDYFDINNLLIKQGRMQRRFKIGNLIISAGHVNWVFKGIKNPHKIKELINKEKSTEYERRTLLRKIL